jgi:hypothetical protein
MVGDYENSHCQKSGIATERRIISYMSAQSNLALSIPTVLLFGVLFQGCFPLPMRAQAQADLPIVMHTNADMPVIGITQDGTVSLNEHTVNLGRLIDEINRTFAKASAVYVRADERASWASVSKVIATLNSAKISIRLVSK